MYYNDSITLRFKVDVNGCMFCNSGLEHPHQWDLPQGKKNLINLHNNFDLLWLFFSAHFHFIDLYKMNLDFLRLNSQIVIFVQPILLFAVYFWLTNICPFLYICSMKFFRGGKKSLFRFAPPRVATEKLKRSEVVEVYINHQNEGKCDLCDFQSSWPCYDWLQPDKLDWIFLTSWDFHSYTLWSLPRTVQKQVMSSCTYRQTCSTCPTIVLTVTNSVCLRVQKL